MVQGWVRDVTSYNNVFADNQIVHFYRSVLAQTFHGMRVRGQIRMEKLQMCMQLNNSYFCWRNETALPFECTVYNQL